MPLCFFSPLWIAQNMSKLSPRPSTHQDEGPMQLWLWGRSEFPILSQNHLMEHKANHIYPSIRRLVMEDHRLCLEISVLFHFIAFILMVFSSSFHPSLKASWVETKLWVATLSTITFTQVSFTMAAQASVSSGQGIHCAWHSTTATGCHGMGPPHWRFCLFFSNDKGSKLLLLWAFFGLV